MTQIVRSVTGAAAATTITAPMTTGSPASGGGTFSVVSGAGYPTANFIVVIDRGTATEEKILISSRASNVLTVATSGRGYDGTAAAAHSNGATLEHVLDALVVTALLEHVNTNAGDDHGTQYLRRSDAAGAGLVIAGGVLAVNVDSSTIEINADALRAKDLGITSAKLAAAAVTAGKIGAGGVSAANQFAAGVVDSTALAAAAVTAGKVAAGGVSAANQFAAGVVDSAALAANAVIAGKLANASIDTLARFIAALRPVTICTSSTRPGSPSVGDRIFETDTGKELTYQSATTGWTPPWNTAWGTVVAPAQVTAAQAANSGTYDATSLTLTYTVVANRRLKISANVQISTDTNANVECILASSIGAQFAGTFESQQAGEYLTHTPFVFTTPAAGTFTQKVRVKSSAGNTTIQGSSAQPDTFSVEDMGPTGAPA